MTPEAKECLGLIHWWRKTYPTYNDHLIRVNNGGKMSKKQRIFAWRMGEVTGASDYFLAMPSGDFLGLWLEMKSKTGRPEDHQIRFLQDMRRVGYCGIVAYGVDEAREIITAWMNERSEEIGWMQACPKKRERNQARKERANADETQ